MTPSVSLEELYNSNILLTPNPGPGVAGTVLTPALSLSAQREAWNVTGSAQYQSSHYSGQSGLNSNDQYLNLQSNYQTELNTLGLNGTYAKESILTSTAFVPDIGLVHVQTQRITRTLSPTWTWTINPNASLQLGYQYNGVSYTEGAQVGLYNYRQHSVNLTLSDQISERNQISGAVGYSYFQVPTLNVEGTDEKSNTSTVMIGLSHQFSETLSGNLSLGAQNTRSAETQCVFVEFGVCYGGTFFSKNTGAIYNASLKKQFKTNTVNINLGRSVSPSGAGTQVLIDSATLGDNWQISQRWLGLASTNAYLIRAVGTNLTELNRDYFSASAELRWLWTRNLKISGSYDYIWVKYVSGGALPAKSNSVYLTLNYSWPNLTASR